MHLYYPLLIVASICCWNSFQTDPCKGYTVQEGKNPTMIQVINCSEANSSTLFNTTLFQNTTILILSRLELSEDDLLNFWDLTNMTALREIDLSQNYLKQIPVEILKPVFHKLEQVNLSGNSIKNIPEEIGNISGTVKIDLTKNPIICNCTTVYIMGIAINNITGNCSVPRNMALQKLITGKEIKCDPCERNGGCNLNLGVCKSISAIHSICQCKDELVTGRFCNQETKPKRTICDKQPCMNSGTCISNNQSNYTCKCSIGVSGTNCEIRKTSTFNNVMIGIIVTVLFLVLLCIAIFIYYKRIKPEREKRRSIRTGRSTKNQTSKTKDKTVQFVGNNFGYNYEDTCSTSAVIPIEEEQIEYPHDPHYAKWLSGRRRCSTVLEVDEKMGGQESIYESGDEE